MPTDPGQPSDPPPPPIGPDPPERPAATEPLTAQIAWIDAFQEWSDDRMVAWMRHAGAVAAWADSERPRLTA